MADQACSIGKQITVRGAISGNEDLVVNGRVEGTINLANRLTVSASGIIEADIEVDELLVDGQISGDVQSIRGVVLGGGARVAGNIRAQKVVIADGAHFNGRIDMDVPLPADVED